MNRAQIRRIKRERYNAVRKAEDRDERAMHQDEILRRYEETYEELHGHKIGMTYANGYVRLDGIKTKAYRLEEIQAMTRELQARIHEREIGGEDE